MGVQGNQRTAATLPKRLLIAASIATAFGGASFGVQAADSMDVLLEKLRGKGVITDSEYSEFQTLREDDQKAASKGDPAELKGMFKDGFTFESADKQHSLSISGRIHADYRSFSEDSTNGNAADTFDIRRAYLGVSGKIYKDWSFEVTSDVAASTLEYAYVNYKASDAVQLRMGAFKMPFSFEELTSSRFVDFQERSLVNAFAPGKDQGLMIYGEPVKNTFSYAVAAMNGSGKNADEANSVSDDKDLIVRLATNLAPAVGMQDGVLHLGVGYTTGTVPGNVAPTGGIRTEGRGLTFFTPGAPGAATNDTDRSRMGLEGVVAFGPIKFQSEYVQANYENSTAAFDRDIDAYYASVNWMITGEKYSDSYTMGGMRAIKPNQPFRKGAEGMGAWELGVRYSKLDAGDFTAGQFTGTNEAEAITIGLKWIPVTPVRVYLNYTQTDFDTPIPVVGGTTDDEKAITLRTAVYF